MSDAPSQQSLRDATSSRAEFSGHGKALGAAGYKEPSSHPENCAFLAEPGQSIAVSPGPGGFDHILIGVAWDNVRVKQGNLFNRLFKKIRRKGVDIDLGVLYELADGTRGAIQAFGEKFGAYNSPPYMQLCGDNRTGNQDGMDETIRLNGTQWDKIKRLLVYLYIYEGAPRWSVVKPQIVLDIPGESDLYVTLKAHNDNLAVCAVGGIENVRGGIKLTNYTEYFPGHAEMDRAFGFGLEWGEGRK